jgi:hypothetical protein
MFRLRPSVVSALAWLALPVSRAESQNAVIFHLQPGMTIADFYSVPRDLPSTTAFSIRFESRFPTSRSWFTPVVGAFFLPYGSTGTTNRKTDAPTLFVGNVFPVLRASSAAGWLSVELPVLLTHSPGAGTTGNIRDFGRDLVVTPTAYIHLGARGFGDLGGFLSGLRLFGQLEQNLTPNRDLDTGRLDRLNPVATVGVSISHGSGSN